VRLARVIARELVRQAPVSASRYLVQAAVPSPLYTLSLHDALPISLHQLAREVALVADVFLALPALHAVERRLRDENVLAVNQFLDRKSTRLNSSHLGISYAVFCLKKRALTFACDCPRAPPAPCASA